MATVSVLTSSLLAHLRREWSLILGIATCAVFAAGGTAVFDRPTGMPWLPLISAWLFLLLIAASLSVVRHADQLAHRLDEPLGTLVRDTLFAVIMIVLLAVLSLILPDFTRTTLGPTLSVYQQLFLAAVSVGLYGIFLAIQTGRHRDYFDPTSSAMQTHTVSPQAHPTTAWLSCSHTRSTISSKRCMRPPPWAASSSRYW